LKSKNENDIARNQVQFVDLQRSIDDIFIDFFKYKKGTLPNERMVKLFKEILKVEI
jgi:exonuclease SbcD